MKLEKRDFSNEWNPHKADFIQLYNARVDEAQRLSAELRKEGLDETTADAVRESLKTIEAEAEKIASLLDSWDEPAEPAGGPDGGMRGFNPAASMEMRTHFFGGKTTMDNNNTGKTEVRSLQRFLSVGINGMTEDERRSLNTSGAAAVLPTTIYNELITNGKYSDLLQRAKVFNEQGAGKLYIPVASHNDASWHTELAAGNEASPTLTKIELGGFELMRLMTMSAATASMTEPSFEKAMLELLSAEVIETLEKSFISGTGEGQPKGLDNLSWVTSGDGQNAIETSATETDPTLFYPINAPYVAEALSLLPQRYSRGAICIMNARTAATIARQGWAEEMMPAYNASSELVRIYGHEVVISEHVGNDTVYVVDPKELYVRFSMPIQIEADRSSGFTSATVNLRALCVVDAAWNPAACVRLTKGKATA